MTFMAPRPAHTPSYKIHLHTVSNTQVDSPFFTEEKQDYLAELGKDLERQDKKMFLIGLALFIFTFLGMLFFGI